MEVNLISTSWVCPLCGEFCTAADLPHICQNIAKVVPNKQDEIIALLQALRQDIATLSQLLRSR